MKKLGMGVLVALSVAGLSLASLGCEKKATTSKKETTTEKKETTETKKPADGTP